MRTFKMSESGRIALVEEPKPTPGTGQVLMRVRATSLNARDLFMLDGRYPVPPGRVPLSDAAGVIESTGPGVTRFQVGDRVVNSFNPLWFGGPQRKPGQNYHTDIDGWLTEYVVIDEQRLASMPEHLDFTEAATLPCAAITAWTALEGVGPGDTVLVQGSGGVSLFALQLARTMGARVITTTSSEHKAARLLELGASDVINYVDMPDWGAEVRKLTDGQGANVVVEVGGAGSIAQSITAVAYRGVISLVGHLQMNSTGMNILDFALSGATLRAIGGGSRSDLEDMNRVITAHKLRPVIGRVFPFEEAPAAASYMGSGAHFGKVVISH
ncbi:MULTISPECIES: zinc-dependent alcohol dehydrogenase family protein [Streptomyces]|uniref:NADPH:quinone oxidoreductase n=1 Tax=Streptomyces canarius TaxID=285453 RepID=A0ABQ3D9X4_9ACTN|nr:NAD(P)-dependent alcohol dehydrogenase [Streptomyces canarius]GHA70078.1 NADPH:quinone oxidoreductase [Streptomyces canarius]